LNYFIRPTVCLSGLTVIEAIMAEQMQHAHEMECSAEIAAIPGMVFAPERQQEQAISNCQQFCFRPVT